MNACLKYSSRIMTLMGIVGPETLRKEILPWELETFLIFAVEAVEYQDADIMEKNERKFQEVINAIRGQDSTERLREAGQGDFATQLIMHYGMLQFDLQEQQEYKYFRYNYFFNYLNEEENVNISREFGRKFGVSYDKVWQLGVALNVFISSHIATKEMVEFIFQSYNDVVQLLTITREDFRSQISSYAHSIEDYEYCLRPSYTFPFLLEENGSRYLPLPHLLYRATTSSFLYRFTENDSEMRTRIGFYVVESYLMKILVDSKAYEEVLSERKYLYNHTECKTPDAMIRIGDAYLFIESKSAVPPMLIRIFDQDALEKHIKQLAEGLLQLYKQLKNFIGGQFYYFNKEKPTVINPDNIWGIVSVLEDSFIKRELIYVRFAQLAGLTLDSQDYSWVITHIKIVSLHDIEKHAFVGSNILGQLISTSETVSAYDFTLAQTESGVIINDSLLTFKKQMAFAVGTLAEKMQTAGIIK